MATKNENLLLLYCARITMSEIAMRRVKKLVAEALQWEQITHSAFSENIAPLLYLNLRDFEGANLVPQNTLDKLKKAYYANLARNIELFSELGRILNAFKTNNVDTMVLKGAALANTVYDNVALRSMADMDILVKENDLPHVKGIMSDLNYTVNTEVRSEEWYKKKHGFHLAPFKHKRKSVAVEIHWSIARQSFGININEWWKRARDVSIDNSPVFIPSAEHMLFHLCLHLHNQNYNIRIFKRGLCDIFETLQYYNKIINWDLFEEEIHSCKIVKPAHSILYLVREFFETADDRLVKINLDRIDLKFIHILKNKLLKYSAFPGPFIGLYATDHGLIHKCRVLFHSVFPEREVMVARYSIPSASKRIYFYYLIRPFALLLRYGKFVFGAFRIKKYSTED